MKNMTAGVMGPKDAVEYVIIDRVYQKYEFCHAVNCPSIRRAMVRDGKCKTPNALCIYSAKDFHKWLNENGFEIIKINKTTPDLLSAAIKTLNDNLHLCDGDVCTLKDLRDAVAKIRPDWRQPASGD